MESKNFQAKVWKVSLENTAIWKILGFHFEPVCPEQAHQNYGVGSPLQIQHDRLSTQEWCNCEKSSLECMRCHEILIFEAFHLNFKKRLSWNTAVLELFAVEFNCEGNDF